MIGRCGVEVQWRVGDILLQLTVVREPYTSTARIVRVSGENKLVYTQSPWPSDVNAVVAVGTTPDTSLVIIKTFPVFCKGVGSALLKHPNITQLYAELFTHDLSKRGLSDVMVVTSI